VHRQFIAVTIFTEKLNTLSTEFYFNEAGALLEYLYGNGMRNSGYSNTFHLHSIWLAFMF